MFQRIFSDNHLELQGKCCNFAQSINDISRAMKKFAFQLKKWSVRAMMTAGAALGLSACFHCKDCGNNGPIEAVYGPPPDIEVIEDVYGPPIGEEPDSSASVNNAEPEPKQADADASAQ